MRTDSIEIKEINYDLIKELAKDKSLVFAKKGNIKGYGLYVNSELVSMVALDFSRQTIKIRNLYTLPDFRNKGYASLLLQKVLDLYSDSDFEARVIDSSKNIFMRAGFRLIWMRKYKRLTVYKMELVRR